MLLPRTGKYTISAEPQGGGEAASANIVRKLSVGSLIADILLTGFVGVIIDAVTGSWNNLEPAEVNLELKSAEGGSLR